MRSPKFVLFGLGLVFIGCKPKPAPNTTAIAAPAPHKILAQPIEETHYEGVLEGQTPVRLKIGSVYNFDQKIRVYACYHNLNTDKVILLDGEVRPDSTIGVGSEQEKCTLTFMSDSSLQAVWTTQATGKTRVCTLKPRFSLVPPADFSAFIARFTPIAPPFATKRLPNPADNPSLEALIRPDDFLFLESLSTGHIPLEIGKKLKIYEPTDTNAYFCYGYKLNLPDQNIGLIYTYDDIDEYTPIWFSVFSPKGELIKTSQLDYLKNAYGYRLMDFNLSTDFRLTLSGYSEEQGREEIELDNGETTMATVVTDELAPFKTTLQYKNHAFE